MGFKQHHFVFVHGAGHGAWCWYKLVAILEKAGHRVTTLDLVGAGDSEVEPDDVTTLEQYSQPLIDFFKSLPYNEKVILVGHSFGGMSLTLVSELFPKKISVAVYPSAIMLPNKMDLVTMKSTYPEFLSTNYDPELIVHTKVEGGPITALEFPLERLRKCFYNLCSEEDIAFATSRIRRFPNLWNLSPPTNITEENYGTVPRVFILALKDYAIDENSARLMIKINPPEEVYEIDTDHSLFFSAPEELSGVLGKTAAKYDS